MEKQYKVVFTGRFLPGFNRDDIVNNLAAKTNLDRERAEKLVAGDKQVLLKKCPDLETAEKFRDQFQQVGLEIQISRPTPENQPTATEQPPQRESIAEPTNAAEQLSSPAPEPMTPPSHDKPSDNPYAAPRSNLKTAKEKNGEWLDQPRKVSASQGFRWIKLAAAMFFQQPWKWLAMSMLAVLIVLPVYVLQMVGPFISPVFAVILPIICSFFNTLLAILLAGGMMLAARKQDLGETIRIKYLFEGFRQNRNQLLLVGLYYMLFFFAFGVILALVLGGGFLTFMGGGPQSANAINTMVQNNMQMFLIGMLVVFAILIPVMMAMWFATPLVALTDKTALTAYKLSFRGCLKNWLAFLVYSLAFLVLACVLMLMVGIVAGLLGFFLVKINSFMIAFLPVVIGFFVWMPMVIIGGLTIFTSFKDIYYQSA